MLNPRKLEPSTAPTSAISLNSAAGNVQNFEIRMPKYRKKHHLMRFNATLNVNFAQWRNAKLEREDNRKEFCGKDSDQPKFGAGSDYIRRKKVDAVAEKYRPEAQPWILEVGGETGKKFRGMREGGAGENSAYYVFTHAPDGAIEAHPLNEWYTFQTIQRYPTLSAAEAEKEFSRRNKVTNFFSLMMRKRLRGEEEPEDDPEEIKKIKGAKNTCEFKITDMDEWYYSGDESESDEEKNKKREREDSDDDEKKGRGKKGANKKKKPDVDAEAFEESDDGDKEGREVDYDTSSSEDDMKRVAKEDALRQLIMSDEEDEDENKFDDSEKENDEKKNNEEKYKDETSKETKAKQAANDDRKASSYKGTDLVMDSNLESTASKVDLSNGPALKKISTKDNVGDFVAIAIASSSCNASKSRSMTLASSDPTGVDPNNSFPSMHAKRAGNELSTSLPLNVADVVNVANVVDTGITEKAVRRYLKRKPLTASELLMKFIHKTGASTAQLLEAMSEVLKKINPDKQKIMGKMYFSIK